MTYAFGSEVDALVGERLARLHVEASGIDRPLAGRRAGILHDQDLAAGCGVEHALEMRVGVVEHRARRAQPSVDRELALQDEPDLREAVIVLGMMRARLEPEDAGIGRGRLLGLGWNSILPVLPGQRMVSQSISSRWRTWQGR